MTGSEFCLESGVVKWKCPSVAGLSKLRDCDSSHVWLLHTLFVAASRSGSSLEREGDGQGTVTVTESLVDYGLWGQSMGV